jgi:hypothetical protein
MKAKGLLTETEHSVTRLERLNLTECQRRDAITYEPGLIVEFHKRGGQSTRESKKSGLKAASSGRSYGVKREL